MNAGGALEVAVICERNGPAADQIRARLRERGIESLARWFRPRDADDVQRAIRDGQVREVILPAPADLMRIAWERRASPGEWLDRGVRIHFAQQAHAGETPLVRSLLDAWARWDATRRRRNTAAGLALTGLAMVLGFVLTRLA